MHLWKRNNWFHNCGRICVQGEVIYTKCHREVTFGATSRGRVDFKLLILFYFWQKVVTCDALTSGHIFNSYLFSYWNIVYTSAQPMSYLYPKNEASDAVVVHKLLFENKTFLVQSTISFLLFLLGLSFARDGQMMCENQSQSGSSSRQSMTLACVVCLFVCVFVFTSGYCCRHRYKNSGPYPSL